MENYKAFKNIKNKHFITEISETLKKHYEETQRHLGAYDQQIFNTITNDSLKDQYKTSESNRLKSERNAYIQLQSNAIEVIIGAQLKVEREYIKGMIFRTKPTAEQLEYIKMIQMMKNPTQMEIDQVAENIRGSYLAERMLSDIASEKGLKFKYQSIEKQIEAINFIESQLSRCYRYTGEPSELSHHNQMIGGGDGLPITYKLYFEHPKKMIELYDAGTFSEKVNGALDQDGSFLHKLSELVNKHPQYAEMADSFITENSNDISEELVDSFIAECLTKELVNSYKSE